MVNYNFEKIKNKILVWFVETKTCKSAKSYSVEISESEDSIIIDYTFKNCLARLTIHDAGFAPYRLVSFEALAINSKKSGKSGIPELIYFFYDSEETEEDDVIVEIQNAINYCIDYIPDELGNKYIGSTGIIKLENSNSKIAIHPDDIEKIDYAKITDHYFTCIDTQFQYLVVKDNEIIRVLPELFEIG